MNTAAVSAAWTWHGTPYHHHGRIKGVGVDCAQLLCAVFEESGQVPHIETGTYPVDWHMHRGEEMFSAWLARYGTLQPVGTAHAPGDVFLFRFGRTFSHGSILVDENLLIHSYIGRGVIVSRFTEEPLSGRETQHWKVGHGR